MITHALPINLIVDLKMCLYYKPLFHICAQHNYLGFIYKLAAMIKVKRPSFTSIMNHLWYLMAHIIYDAPKLGA